MNSRELIKKLEDDGWALKNTKGSYHVFRHLRSPATSRCRIRRKISGSDW